MDATPLQPRLSYPARRPVELGMTGRWLYYGARWARRRSAERRPADPERTTDEDHYRTWRRRELNQQLHDHFDVRLIAGRDVLDFGCGTGELARQLARHAANRVIGVDLSATAIAAAAQTPLDADRPADSPLRFVHSAQPEAISLATDSVDLICCFDVVEHLAEMPAIAREWRRVLRPAGRVWIWWSPWRGPYGHHLDSLIPFPWVHLLLSERTLFKTCAELYDDPDFVPCKWDRDPATGAKKPNKWRTTESFHPFLNRLTRRKFERIVTAAGLHLSRRESHGFSGSPLRRATRALLPLPLIGDCFVSFYIYELTRN